MRTCGRAEEARTGPSTHGRANERTSGRADERTKRSGPPLRGRRVERTGGRADWADWADGRTGSPVVGQMSGLGCTGVLAVRRSDERADERVGLGLKGHIPRGWVHSWAPSPLASSERECVGCLRVQWGPV